MRQRNIQIIGAGSWGTALAVALSAKHRIELYTSNIEVAAKINSTRNSTKHRSITLNDNITAITEIQRNCDYLIIAIPSHLIMGFIEKHLDIIRSSGNLIIASKGMNPEKSELFSDSLARLSLDPCFLSGPNFAHEVANGLTSFSNIAGSLKQAKLISSELSTDNFILEPISDYISVQIAGCYKNILAIYSGYITSLGLGENYRAAICAKAFTELRSIFKDFGGVEESLYSYAAIGDIMLTCFSEHSRNFQMGVNLAKENNIYPAKYIEGITSCKSLYKMLEARGLKYEILSKTYELIRNFELGDYQ